MLSRRRVWFKLCQQRRNDAKAEAFAERVKFIRRLGAGLPPRAHTAAQIVYSIFTEVRYRSK